MTKRRNGFRARLARWLLDGYDFNPTAERPLIIAYSGHIILQNCEAIAMHDCVVDVAENVMILSVKQREPSPK